jgi:hypothetical protein
MNGIRFLMYILILGHRAVLRHEEATFRVTAGSRKEEE